MRRVVGIVLLIGGVLLATLTGGLLIQRQHTVPPTLVLLSTADYRLTYAAAYEGQELRLRPKIPAGRLYEIGTSPNGKWLYLRQTRATPRGNKMTAVRVQLENLRVETLPAFAPITQLFWSPDGQWIFYKAKDPLLGYERIYRARPDGSQIRDITPTTEVLIGFDNHFLPTFSPENEWIAVMGLTRNYQVYRLDLHTTEMTQLTANIASTSLRGYIRNASGEWLLVSTSTGVYRIGVHGSAVIKLLPEHVITDYNTFVWSDARLILMLAQDPPATLYAVSMDDFSVVWSIPQRFPIRATMQGSHILATGPDGLGYAIDAAGQITPLGPLVNSLSHYEFSPDHQWLVYIIGRNVYAVRVSDGQQHVLYQGAGRIEQLAWGVDGQSVILLEQTPNGNRVWQVALAQSRRYPLVHLDPNEQYLGLGQLVNRTVSGVTLLAMSGVCVLVAGVHLAKGK